MARRPRGASLRVPCCSILLLAMLSGSLCAHAQAREPVRFESASLATALRQLQDEGLKILFSSDLVRPDMIVTEEPRGRWPREILDEILAPHALWAEQGPAGTLLVVRAHEPGTIMGVVRLSENGVPAGGARVTVIDTGKETRTDSQGRFTIGPIPPGRYSVQALLNGFLVQRRDEVPVEPGRTTRLLLALGTSPAVREDVVVHSRDPAPLGTRPESRQSLRGDELLSSPEFGRDALLPVTRLPGVASADGSGSLNVRGGGGSDVKFVLDGLELYEPYHLQDRGSPVSIIDSRNLAGIELLSGAFPAQYGGHMGAVIEMDSRAAVDDPRTSLALASDEARVASEGAIGSRAHWFASARRGNASALLENLAADPNYAPAYWDAFARVDYGVDDRTSLGIDLLAAHDFVARDEGAVILTVDEPGTFRSYHASSYLWLHLRHAFSPTLFSHSMLSVGVLKGDRSGSTSVSAVDDLRATRVVGLKQDWLLKRGRHSVRWGLDAKLLTANYEYSAIPGEQAGLQAMRIDASPDGRDHGLYLSDEFRPWAPVNVSVGLRWDDQTYAPGKGAVSPRVNVSYAPDERTTLRAGWGYFYQSQKIHELQVEDGVTKFFPSERAEHRMLGIERDFGQGLVVALDAYQKSMSGLHPRFENLFDPYGLFPETGSDRVRIDAPRARAEGLEISARGPMGQKLGWRAGYSFARAEDLVEGSWVSRSWEQTHSFDAGLAFRPTPQWEVSLAGAHHSGRPTTPWTTQTQLLADGSTEVVPIPGERNRTRLPAYARLDFGIRRSFAIHGTTLSGFLNVTNVTDRKNVCCVEDPSPDAATPYRYGLTRLLTYGMSWTF